MSRSVLVTAPSTEPITTATAKTHLRVDHSEEDTYIDTLITVARRYAEMANRRRFITQTWDLFRDGWDEPIALPKNPVQSITSITYYGTDSTAYTAGTDLYALDTTSQPARIWLEHNQTWPSGITLRGYNPIRVRYVAGFGDAASDVPEHLTQAMLLLIGHWYENREDVVLEQGLSAIRVPNAARALLMIDRFWQ